MQTISIKGELRTEMGSGPAKRLRRAGLIPCEIYGGGENLHFAVTPNAVKSIVYTPDFKLAEIELDGNRYKSIVKKIQFHPVTDEIVHIDFLKLVKGQPLKVMVPIKFEGTSPGVKSGGTLSQKLHRVEIKTTPDHLIDTIVMDISALELGESLRVQDIEIPDEVQILNGPTIPVASVAIPRALKSAEEEEAEAAEAAAEAAEGEEGAEEGEGAEAASKEKSPDGAD